MNIQDEIKKLFSSANRPGTMFPNNEPRESPAEKFARLAAEERQAKIDKARSELNAHLRQSAARGRHDYQHPNVIEQ